MPAVHGPDADTCKVNKRTDKYKIVKPPMRVDRIITHELKDKGQNRAASTCTTCTIN